MKVVKNAASHGLPFKILFEKGSFYYIKSLNLDENPSTLRLEILGLNGSKLINS